MPEDVSRDASVAPALGPGFSETPAWRITLAWRQTVAAFWSISWPAWLASVCGLAVFAFDDIDLDTYAPLLSLIGQAVYLGVQLPLVHRLVRKNYRSFRITVIRDDGPEERHLTMREAVHVWLWIVGPQLALYLSSGVLALWYSDEEVRRLSGLVTLLRFLVLGPYGVGLAVRAKYRGFRLQAYGYRYI